MNNLEYSLASYLSVEEIREIRKKMEDQLSYVVGHFRHDMTDSEYEKAVRQCAKLRDDCAKLYRFEIGLLGF